MAYSEGWVAGVPLVTIHEFILMMIAWIVVIGVVLFIRSKHK